MEGPRFITDAIASGASPLLVALSESYVADVDWLERADLSPRILDDELFESLADTVTSQGALAVFPFPELEPPKGQAPLILVADGIQDPGNLGTLIRSAAGAGATHIVTLPGTVDPRAPKTVRAAAAAHFLIPMTNASRDELVSTFPDTCMLVAADAAGDVAYDEVDLTGPLAIIIGSEGSGLSEGVRKLDPLLISIPLGSSLESLNAGVAGAIILFEASRQRRSQAKSRKTPVSI